jgi:hypothetical protein
LSSVLPQAYWASTSFGFPVPVDPSSALPPSHNISPNSLSPHGRLIRREGKGVVQSESIPDSLQSPSASHHSNWPLFDPVSYSSYSQLEDQTYIDASFARDR